ncbi:MAG: putative toxin-antitoxin system toxin component, PIN family [Steroidobacteraceae bacterium]|nr:putative toxin-antitoxin system toxin component, PIN family [Steroidobacteraceae bacterium]MCW5571986.1 putative toxin-antitoxin system toxin component, PIN family [Steroidobacteraceae bacterium]
MRVALDTNVLVSAVATRGLCADVFNLVLAEHELIVGETVLSELRRVLGEKMRVPGTTIDEFVALLRQEATVVKKAEELAIKIRDRTDVPVLSEAVAGNAEVLVTGDADLTGIADKLPLQILSPRGFWEQLRRNPSRS